MKQGTLFGQDSVKQLARRNDPQTSKDAAASDKRRLYEAMKAVCGSVPNFTAPEAAQRAAMLHGGTAESYRKRVHELQRDGVIRLTGDRRDGCRVWESVR